MSIISIKNLSFGYIKNKIVLNDLSVEIEKGKVYSILGKNGCGKSTLIDCIIGYIDDYKGAIFLRDKDIKDYSSKELANEIAFIPQTLDSSLDYSVFDFVLFGRNCKLGYGSVFSENDYQIVSKALKKVGILELEKRSINKLSGGERQLAFIARSLVQESDIIIMDEPTSALDYGNQQRFIKLVEELNKEGKTIIFSVHNPNYCLSLNSQVIAISDGKVAKIGLANLVLDEELIKQLYGDDITFN